MKFITDVKLKKKEYLDALISGEDLIVIKDNQEIGKLPATNTIKDAFKNGRKPLLAVKKTNKDKSYELALVRWADIHGHTEYSLLDGAVRIKDKAAKTEYVSAITDHGNMFGLVKFHKAMEQEDKHAIFGVEFYVENIEGEKRSNHLIVLAKNETGYKNLLKLTSSSYENFYRKPHISYEMLENHSEGLIVTSACLGGEIQRNLNNNEYKNAKKVALRFKKIFKDDFYLEIQRHFIGEEEDRVNAGLVKLSKDINVKLVVGIDSHYTNTSDRESHEVLLALQTGKTMNSPDRMTFNGSGYHIHTADEIDRLFDDLPEAINNTLEIARKCEFDLELHNLHMPQFDIPTKQTDDEYLKELTEIGFNERFENHTEEERAERIERMNYELDVISKMGYSSYFLIVWDYIKFAKDNGIYVGPGRGSAIGSLVSFCLGIVDLDPIDYGLYFERFLNPERVSMPDIDTDFCFERREEVIDYIKEKYGEHSVSRIVTIGTLAAKMVIRDVTRTLDYPYFLGDMIAKSIPTEPDMTLNKAFDMSPDFKELYNENADAKVIIDMALQLEGLPRNTSIHACGLVVAPSEVDNYLPEFIPDLENPEMVSQVTMTEVEDLGILKMDLLGLKTMTVFSHAVESIKRTLDSNFNYDDIPLIDPYVYRDIAKGRTFGVFQLEGGGMRGLMSKLYADVAEKISYFEKHYGVYGLNGNTKTTRDNADIDGFKEAMDLYGKELFERLIAGISLYRPGPMDFIPDYLEGMKNPEDIKYIVPELEEILKATYGVVTYQEQVMQVVQKLGGFSLGQADLIRRAMGKKMSDEEMLKLRDKFIEGELDDDGNIVMPGCIRSGVSRENGIKIWDLMKDFNKYAFNKSHSAGYAVIAVKTAFLKYYYPVDFMSATLNAYIIDSDKVMQYLAASSEMGIKLQSPTLNNSLRDFSKVDDSTMSFGFRGIKYISSMAQRIVDERTQRGNFTGLQDFAERMAKYEKIDKRVIEGLIYSGATDELGYTRSSLLEAVPSFLKNAKAEKDIYNRGQTTMFDLVEDGRDFLKVEIKDVPEYNKRYKLEKEKEFTGYYLSEHPLDDYAEYFNKEDITESYKMKKVVTVDDVTGEETVEESEIKDESFVKVAGLISDKKIVYTKKDNKAMAILEVEDRTGTVDMVIFPRSYEKFGHLIQEGTVLLFEGIFNNSDDKNQVIVNSIVDLDKLLETPSTKNITAIGLHAYNNEQLIEINNIIENNVGNIPVYVKINKQTLKTIKNISISLTSLLALERTVGEDQVTLIH